MFRRNMNRHEAMKLEGETNREEEEQQAETRKIKTVDVLKRTNEDKTHGGKGTPIKKKKRARS